MVATAPSSSRLSRRVRRYLAELWRRREFAWYLALGSLKARNASTALGVVWWVLDPILLGAVYFLVFGLVLGTATRGGPDYVGYLLSGMFAFYYTRSAVQGSSTTIIQNTRLLANVKFPRLLLPISSLIQAFIGFLASLVVFVAFISPQIGYPGRMIAILPLVVLIHTVFNLGIGTFFARLVVPFRDVNNLLPYLLRLWLYLSPIIWQLDRLETAEVPTFIRDLLEFNPMFPLLSLYRSALTNSAFDPSDLVSSSIWAIALVILGVGSFVRFESKMVRYL